MGQALYRKYRSKSLSEIVGQDHITQTLKQALKQGRISHAYLFTGPRGVGKTSIARILAYEINALEYGSNNASLDIIEIDAASNRRIDEIRELREKVHVAPTSAKYKVYIIDEVHMLTREAFNALLKTLEEPPEHAVFILATTDSHKLPETIVSRTQRFTFRPVPVAKVAAHLKEIAAKEKIIVSDGALKLLAEHGEGSFRDSISMLDQASNHAAKLDETAVRQLLGIPPQEVILTLVSALVHGQSAELVQALQSLYDQGYQAPAVAKQLSQDIRQNILQGTSELPRSTAFELLNNLLKVPVSHNAERFLEIILLQSLSPNIAPTSLLQDTTSNTGAAKPNATSSDASEDTIDKPVVGSEQSVVPPESIDKNTNDGYRLTSDNWDNIVELIKKRHNTLYGVIRMAEPTFADDGTLTLVFAFAFHQKRCNEAASQKAVASIAEEVTGHKVHIVCTLDTSKQPEKTDIPRVKTPKPIKEPEQVAAISNIFGGGELLES